MKNCLLVEPDYKVKYPNLALCKISTKLKKDGHNVTFYKGKMKRNLDNWDTHYDYIYITSLFTYESDIVIDTINYYKRCFKSSEIIVGGIFATLMPEYLKEKTGVEAYVGYSKELDMLPPDYGLIKTGTDWDNFSFVFTTRGCKNKCAFCAVKKLEPDLWVNPNWKNAIDFTRKNVMIHDNNLTCMPLEHFVSVCDFLKKQEFGVIFDNGFDARYFTEDHLKAIQGVKILPHGLRFAFDGMQSDGHIQKTLQMCLDAGIKKECLMVYVLFNFHDTPQEAEWRMREIVKLGVRVYPQQYTPLDKLSRLPTYIGEHWTIELTREFRFFYLMIGYYTKMTFPEYLQKENMVELMKEFDLRKVVTKRTFDTPVSINQFLRENKKMTIQEIADKLNLPKTQVDHYFRTDEARAIPSPEVWMQMKVIMGFDDTMDKFVTETYQKLMEYEMSQRVYSEEGVSPTIQSTEAPLIVLKKHRKDEIRNHGQIVPTLTESHEHHGGANPPMIADFRNDEGLRIRKKMLSPTLATRKHSETDISTMPPIIFVAPNKKQIDLSNAPLDRPFQITEARTEEGKQSRKDIREKEGRDSTLRGKDHKKYVPLNQDIANCITTGKENIEKWVFEEPKIDVIEKDFLKKNQYLMGTNGVSQTINAEGFGSFGHTGLYEIPDVAQAIQSDGQLRSGSSWNSNVSQSSRNIRRLTPIECERLQGFPDNWTQEGKDAKGKVVTVSDTQRYKVLGNAITVNVIEAIGKQFCRTIDDKYVSKKEIKVGETKSIDEWL